MIVIVGKLMFTQSDKKMLQILLIRNSDGFSSCPRYLIGRRIIADNEGDVLSS